MPSAPRCPRCGARKSWILKGGRRRCAQCRYDWTPGRLPLRLSAAEWRAILQWFVRGVSSAEVARETRLDRKRVLRALRVVRTAILRAAAAGHHRAGAAGAAAAVARMHAEAHDRSDAPTSRMSRRRPPTLGLYATEGRVWAEVIPEFEAEQLGQIVGTRTRQSSAPAHFARFAAVVYRGRLYRLAESAAARAPFGQVEAFWAYLQRQLRAKGGVRRERLDLYLAEFAWRYNHRKNAPSEQVRELLALVQATSRWSD